MSDKPGLLAAKAPSAPTVRESVRPGPAGLPIPQAEVHRPAPGSYVVEVNLKPEFADAAGLTALRMLHGAGIAAARGVRVGRLYDLRGPLNLGHVHVAVRELLCDCVTQEFRLCHGAAAASPNSAERWRVEVWLKPAVADTAAESVRAALGDLGMPEVAVRCGLAYHIAAKCGRGQLDKAVARSLANPAIHLILVHEDR